ncbi:H-NS histone family protein [Burkholderia ambifaria]|uniref:H-NS histone family protein n=1 Tax=Burkholderia ambifaria TaxID=152480 RepID=UPI002FE38084
MATLKELLVQRAEIESEIERLRTQERDAAIAEIRQKMADHGITVNELARTSLDLYGRRPRRPVPVKYLNTSTGEKWSGRGRAPAWIANVADRDVFRV